MVNRITFQPPMNTLSDGSCCNSTCGMNQTCCASTSCSPTLRLCFRESGHPREDTDSNCPILEIDRTNVNQQLVVFGIDNLPIPRYFSVSEVLTIFLMDFSLSLLSASVCLSVCQSVCLSRPPLCQVGSVCGLSFPLFTFGPLYFLPTGFNCIQQ